jgi:hypothetical protein
MQTQSVDMTKWVQSIISTTINAAKLQGEEWPIDMEIAVVHKCHDKQFPQVKQDWYVNFLKDEQALDAWIVHKQEWIRGTDYDFSMEYRIYDWDWGPVLRQISQM